MFSEDKAPTRPTGAENTVREDDARGYALADTLNCTANGAHTHKITGVKIDA